MTADLALVSSHPILTVIDGGLSPKRGRPSLADDHRLEMAMRQDEEREMSEALVPLMRRLAYTAREGGPTTFRTVAAIQYLLDRHARRWAPEAGETA